MIASKNPASQLVAIEHSMRQAAHVVDDEGRPICGAPRSGVGRPFPAMFSGGRRLCPECRESEPAASAGSSRRAVADGGVPAAKTRSREPGVGPRLTSIQGGHVLVDEETGRISLSPEAAIAAGVGIAAVGAAVGWAISR